MLDVPFVALVALALVPGVRAYIVGRALGVDQNDPALAERYLAYGTSAWSWVGGVGFMLALPRGPTALLWVLTLLGTAVGGFPARRRVLQESWGLFRYLDHALRFNLAPMSFWLLALAMPAVAMAAGRYWPVAVGTGAAMFLFLERRFTWFTVRCKRAAPLRDETLLASLAEIAGRSRVPMPAVLVAPVVGGRWPNAVALPRATGSHVIYGQTLIEAMPTDEVCAVFAHELAHLEHYAEPRERRKLAIQFWGLTLLSLGVAIVAGLREAIAAGRGGDTVGLLAIVGWLLVWSLLYMKATSGHQSHEADSDKRAAELVGDPEPLVRALVRLHFLARHPARAELDFETSASHPSLRKRIQALRALGGAAARAEAPAPLVLRSPAPGRWAIVGHEGVVLLDGVPAEGTELAAPEPAALRALARESRVFTWGDLADVRVTAEGVATPNLMLLTKQQQRFELPVGPTDVAALQAHLDVAPHTPDLAAARKAKGGFFNAEWVATVVFFMSIIESYNVAAGLLLALGARGSTGPLAMAAALASQVAFLLVHTLIWKTHSLGVFAIFKGILLAGAFGLWRASRRRAVGEAPVSRTSFRLQVAAVGACVLWSVVQLTGDRGWAGLRLDAYHVPDAGVPLVVLAAVLWKHRRAWVLATLCLAVACVPAVVGTPWAAQTFGLDSLVATRPELALHAERAAEIGRRELDRRATVVSLSPQGMTFSVYDYDEENPPCRQKHLVGELEGPLREVEACEVAPLDDGGVMAIVDLASRGPSRLALRRLARGGQAPVWERALDMGSSQRLEVDEGGAVRVVGWDPKLTQVIDLRGQIDDPATLAEVRRFPAEKREGPFWIEQLHDDAGATLRLTHRENGRLPRRLAHYRRGWTHTTLAWGEDESAIQLGQSVLRVDCPTPRGRTRGFFCAASDRDQTFLWRVDGGHLAFVGRVPRYNLANGVDLGDRVGFTWGSWIYLVDRAGSSLTALYVDTDGYVHGLAAGGGRLAALAHDQKGDATLVFFDRSRQATP